MRNPFRKGPRGMWADVEELTRRFDAADGAACRWWWTAARRRAAREHAVTLRVAKCGEEAGEAIAARGGVLGQNPRKGVWADDGDVIAELCDVTLSSLVALRTVAGSAEAARAALSARVATMMERVPE